MLNVNNVKLLSERTSGVPLVIFSPVFFLHQNEGGIPEGKG